MSSLSPFCTTQPLLLHLSVGRGASDICYFLGIPSSRIGLLSPPVSLPERVRALPLIVDPTFRRPPMFYILTQPLVNHSSCPVSYTLDQFLVRGADACYNLRRAIAFLRRRRIPRTLLRDKSPSSLLLSDFSFFLLVSFQLLLICAPVPTPTLSFYIYRIWSRQKTAELCLALSGES